MASAQNQSDSESTKTIVTVLLLIFAYPIGIIVMWFWPKWKTWVKVVLSLPVILLPFAFLAAGALIVANPVKKINNTQIQQVITSPSPAPSIKAKPTTAR